jgi:hypothetical protein
MVRDSAGGSGGMLAVAAALVLVFSLPPQAANSKRINMSKRVCRFI